LIIFSPLWQHQVKGNLGVKIFFTTNTIVSQDGRQTQRKKQLNVRTIFFDNVPQEIEIDEIRGVTNDELSAMKQSILSRRRRMTEDEWEEYATNVCVKEFLVQKKSILKSGVIGRNQKEVSITKIGIYSCFT